MCVPQRVAKGIDQLFQRRERACWMYVIVTEDVYPVGASLSTTLEFPTPQLTSPNPNYKEGSTEN